MELKAKAQAATQEAARLRATVAARSLPEAEAIKALQALQSGLERAEAALGGGLSATISLGKSGVEVEVHVDGEKPSRSSADRAADASRAIELLDRRRGRGPGRSGRCRKPHTGRGVAAAVDFRGPARLGAGRPRFRCCARRGPEQIRMPPCAKPSSSTRTRAITSSKLHRSKRDPPRSRGSRSGSGELEAGLEGRDRQALATIVKKVGSGWESHTEKAEKDLDRSESKARTDKETASTELAGLGGQVTQITTSLAAARDESKRARAALEGDPETILLTVAASIASVDAEAGGIRAELQALQGAGTKAVSEAKSRMDAAEQSLSSAVGATKVAGGSRDPGTI